jgi:hypothetical protein
MRFEISDRLSSQSSTSDIYAALNKQFRKISAKVVEGQGEFKATAIEASFGSINRKDETVVSIKTVEGGYLLVADVWYRPSLAFWIILAITLFSWVGWLIPIGFYLYQKKTVSKAIRACFERIKNEFEHTTSSPPAARGESFERALERLGQLKEKGLLSDEEFKQRKTLLLHQERATLAALTAEPARTSAAPSQSRETVVAAPENNSSFKSHDLPPGVKGWSWGGFLLSVFWAIGNRTWIGLLTFVPVVGLAMPIVLGVKGREWAWRNGKWAGIEHFRKVQRKWAIAGVIFYAVSLVIIGGSYGFELYEQHRGAEDVGGSLSPAELKQLNEPVKISPQAEALARGSVQDQEPPPSTDPVPDPIFSSKTEAAQTFETLAGSVALTTNPQGDHHVTLNGRALFEGPDAAYQYPISLFHLTDGSEALLMHSSGGRGTSCETLFFFVIFSKTSPVRWTPEFGSCVHDGTMVQVGDEVDLSVPKMGGFNRYRFNGGNVTEDGKPVALNAENDPTQ